MLGPVGQIGGLIAYLATARRQGAGDRATARQLAWSGSLPPGLGLHIEVAGTRSYHQGSADLIEDEIRDRDGHAAVSRADRACVTAGTDHLDPLAVLVQRRTSPGFADEVHRASRDLVDRDPSRRRADRVAAPWLRRAGER